MNFRRAIRRVLLAATMVAGFASLIPIATHAQLQGAVQNAQLTAEAAGVSGGSDLITIIGRIIYVFLSFLGIIFLVLMLYAGYTWMTAGGDEKKVEKAKLTIRNAVIGLIIIATSFAIVSFVLGLLAGTGTGIGGIGGQKPPPPGGFPGSSGSLGKVIEYHLPERDATGVPRNTPIIISFKDPIRPDSFIDGWTDATSGTAKGLNSANIKIYRADAQPNTALTSNAARVFYTKDLRTYVIRPVDYLGSSTVNVKYRVDLTGGSSGIKKADNTPAFSGVYSGGYYWLFEVSTVVDLTPPYVIAAIPQSGGQYDRNIIVQLNFNEAVDPTATSGKTSDGFSNLEVRAGAPGDPNPQLVSGEFKLSNRYQTVEFIPDVKCGTNSCGRDIFCLPGLKTIQVTAKAANLDPQAIPQAVLTNNGYDGVVDVCGNSMDGDRNGTAQGPPADTYTWSFGTTDNIKLTPPQIEATQPSSDPQSGGNSNIPVDQQVVAKFDTLLQSSTLNSENASIDAHGKDETDPDKFWYFVGMKLLTTNGSDFDPNKVPPDIAAKAGLVLNHRPYLPSGTGLANLNFYDPYILSGVQDAYQNCFNPASKCGSDTRTANQRGSDPNCCNSTTDGDPKGCKAKLHP